MVSPLSYSVSASRYDASSASVNGEVTLWISVFENISIRVLSGSYLSMSIIVSSDIETVLAIIHIGPHQHYGTCGCVP